MFMVGTSLQIKSQIVQKQKIKSTTAFFKYKFEIVKLTTLLTKSHYEDCIKFSVFKLPHYVEIIQSELFFIDLNIIFEYFT